MWNKVRKFFAGLVAAIAALFYTSAVLAEEKTFSWTMPTEYTDGSELPVEEIQFTRIYCDNGVVITVPGPATSVARDFNPGTYSCYATVTSINGMESLPSNSTEFTVEFPTPNAPVLSVD